MTIQEKKKREKDERQGLLPHQIRAFYREKIGELRKTVSLSRKGKPRKQQWGFHIVKLYDKRDTS